MYAGLVACYTLTGHGEYADGTDKEEDGRQTVTGFVSQIGLH